MTESGTTFYVNQAAPSGGDGTSWATAYTERHNCFFRKLENDQWTITSPVLKDPDTIYKK